MTDMICDRCDLWSHFRVLLNKIMAWHPRIPHSHGSQKIQVFRQYTRAQFCLSFLSVSPLFYTLASLSNLTLTTNSYRRRKLVRHSISSSAWSILISDLQKCSGTRPTCDMCNHYNRVHECQYDDSSKKSYTQILREKTSELEAKLRKLEGESSCTPQGTLFSDFPNYLEPDTTLSDDIHNALYVDYKTIISIRSNWLLQSVQTFFRHHKQCCFYSNSSRFDFSSSAILFQHNPPSSSLMSAIHLLGSFFSHTPHLNELQFILLDQASRNLSRSLHDNWQELSMESKMDDVQASCLLAQYCYFNHRMLEGNQKLLTAKRLASVLGLYSVSGPDISAPQETTEKLAVFWQVFTVDKFWSATNQDLMLPDVAPFLNPTTPLPVKEGVALVSPYMILASFRIQLLSWFRASSSRAASP